jgi:hypothetical protein
MGDHNNLISFNVTYNNSIAFVTEIAVGENRTFTITFDDKRPRLTITVAHKPDGSKWWTSIPQGRQVEAEEVGKLIATYLRAKRKEQQ